MRLIARVFGVVGALLLVLGALWLVLAAPGYRAQPLDRETSATFAGGVAVQTEFIRFLPLAAPLSLTLQASEHTYPVDPAPGEHGQTVLRQDHTQRYGVYHEIDFAEQFAVDNDSHLQVKSPQAYSFAPANQVDRSGSYLRDLPVHPGSGPYPIWSDYTGAKLDVSATGATENVLGVTFAVYTGRQNGVPASADLLRALRQQTTVDNSLPTRISLAQSAGLLAAAGINATALADLVDHRLLGTDRAALLAALADRDSVEYLVDSQRSYLFEPVTGLQGRQDSSTVLWARLTPATLRTIADILAQPRYANDPAVALGAGLIDKVAANPPRLQILSIDYDQTFASVSMGIPAIKAAVARIHWGERVVPTWLLIPGFVLVAAALLLTWRRRLLRAERLAQGEPALDEGIELPTWLQPIAVAVGDALRRIVGPVQRTAGGRAVGTAARTAVTWFRGLVEWFRGLLEAAHRRVLPPGAGATTPRTAVQVTARRATAVPGTRPAAAATSGVAGTSGTSGTSGRAGAAPTADRGELALSSGGMTIPIQRPPARLTVSGRPGGRALPGAAGASVSRASRAAIARAAVARATIANTAIAKSAITRAAITRVAVARGATARSARPAGGTVRSTTTAAKRPVGAPVSRAVTDPAGTAPVLMGPSTSAPAVPAVRASSASPGREHTGSVDGGGPAPTVLAGGSAGLPRTPIAAAFRGSRPAATAAAAERTGGDRTGGTDGPGTCGSLFTPRRRDDPKAMDPLTSRGVTTGGPVGTPTVGAFTGGTSAGRTSSGRAVTGRAVTGGAGTGATTGSTRGDYSASGADGPGKYGNLFTPRPPRDTTSKAPDEPDVLRSGSEGSSLRRLFGQRQR